MILNIVPARTGVQWVREGVKTFFRQPLALIGLFFMYMALILIVSQVPLVGVALAGVLAPATTLGLMAATQEATRGRFPMPTVLLSAFRVGRQRLNAMLVLGVIYTLLSLLASAVVSALVPPTPTSAGDLQQVSGTVVLTMLLHLPLFLMFWHAPALVHWHGVPPVKSLFFSVVACLRNAGAFVVYGLAWGGIVTVMAMAIALLASIAGNAQLASVIMMPFAFLMAAMMSTSVYFTFRDCFVADPSAPALP